MSVINRRGTPESSEPGKPPSAVDELSKPLPVRVPRNRMRDAFAGLRRLGRRGKD